MNQQDILDYASNHLTPKYNALSRALDKLHFPGACRVVDYL